MEEFSEKKNQERTMTPELKEKLDELAEKGNQLEEEERYEEAVRIWEKGLDLIPEPKQCYSEFLWFLVAVGDVYFMEKKYQQAYKCFNEARGNLSGDGYGNPYVMLRLGECCLEIGDEKNAAEYLLRAYMMEGKDIFEMDEDEEKYFDFLRTHVENIE